MIGSEPTIMLGSPAILGSERVNCADSGSILVVCANCGAYLFSIV